MKLNNKEVLRCSECKFMKAYDYGKRICYCDHENRTDDMGKLNEKNLTEACAEWCPLTTGFEASVLREWIKKSDINKINGYFISDEQIKKELESITEKELDRLCAAVDKTLKCRTKNCADKPDEITKSAVKADLFNIGADNNVSAAAVWDAYLKQLDEKGKAQAVLF